jgi:neutral ceramidase
MKAGFARVEMTPHPGEHPEMMGFGPFLGRTALEVLQPLHLRASYLEQEGAAALLLSLELCGLREDLADTIRQAAAEAVGLAPEQVQATCTHTHSAPSVMPIIGWGEYDAVTAGRLPGLAAAAARKARERAASVVVSAGQTELSGFARNRVYGAEGPLDTGLRVLAFREAQGGALRGLWAHYTCHPVLLCEQSRVISPDYCGVAMQALEAEQSGAVCTFLQGYCGDINPVWVHLPQERSVVHLAHAAYRFGTAVATALAAARDTGAARVQARSQHLSLPVHVLDDPTVHAFQAHAAKLGPAWERLASKAGPQMLAEGKTLRAQTTPQRAAPLGALAVGEHTLVFHPFEMFTDVGLKIRAGLDADKTWVVGYVNGYEGYAPTRDRFSPVTGDYAAHGVPLMMGRHPYTADLGDELADGLVALGRSVAG